MFFSIDVGIVAALLNLLPIRWDWNPVQNAINCCVENQGILKKSTGLIIALHCSLKESEESYTQRFHDCYYNVTKKGAEWDNCQLVALVKKLDSWDNVKEVSCGKTAWFWVKKDEAKKVFADYSTCIEEIYRNAPRQGGIDILDINDCQARALEMVPGDNDDDAVVEARTCKQYLYGYLERPSYQLAMEHCQ